MEIRMKVNLLGMVMLGTVLAPSSGVCSRRARVIAHKVSTERALNTGSTGWDNPQLLGTAEARAGGRSACFSGSWEDLPARLGHEVYITLRGNRMNEAYLKVRQIFRGQLLWGEIRGGRTRKGYRRWRSSAVVK